VRFGYRQKYALILNDLIGKPQVSEHFTAPDFKPAKVITVIGLSHIVGVAVYNAIGGAMAIHKGFPLNE
jgi:hypothetical protein